MDTALPKRRRATGLMASGAARVGMRACWAASASSHAADERVRSPNSGPHDCRLLCALHAARCALHAARCALHAARCALHAARCALHAARCALHAARCALHAAWRNRERFNTWRLSAYSFVLRTPSSCCTASCRSATCQLHPLAHHDSTYLPPRAWPSRVSVCWCVRARA
jgi:hypothetical protein